MTLQERLESMDPEEYVKIGTAVGSGWMYAGKVKGYWEHDAELTLKAGRDARRQVDESWTRLIVELNKFPGRNKATEKDIAKFSRAVNSRAGILTRMMRTQKNAKPLHEREIVEEFPALGEKATNILLEGAGDGCRAEDGDVIYRSQKMEPIEDLNNEGAARLIAAMFKEDTDILTMLYYKRMTLKHEFPAEERAALAAKEREIKHDVYGLFEGDGEGVIKMCKRAAEERIKAEKEKKKR